MRVLKPGMAAKIASGDFTGANKATCRVTIQKVHLTLGGWGTQVYSSILFENTAGVARELPNIKSCNWERSADSDTGSMSLELYNTRPMPPGSVPDTGDSFDLLGYYTYNRGRTAYSSQAWGHTPNHWQDYLVPDRLIRVYQGYGVDYTVPPEDDPNLVLTGVWLVDDVTYTADGLITLECRDTSRMLSEQTLFPPVVPLKHYPLSYESYRDVPNPPKYVSTLGWVKPVYEVSSNGAKGSKTEKKFGHHPADAFDNDTESYWLSAGHKTPNSPSSFEWIQATTGGKHVNAVKLAVRGGDYRVYLSYYTDKAKGGAKTGWIGKVNVPYKPGALGDNGSKIPYIKSGVVKRGGELILNTSPTSGVTKIRLTFTSLHNSKQGSPYVYRAALRNVEYSTLVQKEVDSGTHREGNYGDYSHIVKRLLAYGGFWWPQDGVQHLTDGNTRTYHFDAGDPYLMDEELGMTGRALARECRVWGDIMMSGTAGMPDSPLGVEVWDKKPIIDGINYVKDVLGFVFFVDENGGAVFRSPNLFRLGNWVIEHDGYNARRSKDIPEIRDDEIILGLRAKLSSRNMREHVFVANTTGGLGAVSNGRIQHPVGFRRVGGWTDQNFGSAREAQIMADLITLRQLFTWRQDALRIPANPALQVDDQVRILERTTGNAYVHYLRGISSSWDIEEGQWIYDLTTSWLGADPEGEWAFDTKGLHPATYEYLLALGQISPGQGVPDAGPQPATLTPAMKNAKEVDMIILKDPDSAAQWLCDKNTKTHLQMAERNALVAAGVPYLDKPEHADGIRAALTRRTTTT